MPTRQYCPTTTISERLKWKAFFFFNDMAEPTICFLAATFSNMYRNVGVFFVLYYFKDARHLQVAIITASVVKLN